MNQQRKVIYAERRRILEGEDLQQQATRKCYTDVITAYVGGATSEGLCRGLGSGRAVDGAQDAVPGRGSPTRT